MEGKWHHVIKKLTPNSLYINDDEYRHYLRRSENDKEVCFKNSTLEFFVLKGKVHPNRKIQSLVLRQPKWICSLCEPRDPELI